MDEDGTSSSSAAAAAGALESELQILTETETLRVPITGVILTGSDFDCRRGDDSRSTPEVGAGVKLIDVNPRFGAFGVENEEQEFEDY